VKDLAGAPASRLAAWDVAAGSHQGAGLQAARTFVQEAWRRVNRLEVMGGMTRADAIGAVLGGVAGLAHYRIEDGPGRPLGRAFKIKRWPTLVFLHDGREVERLVRPAGTEPIREALDKALHPPAPDAVLAKL
jgi:hypothetical protein